jgi:N6-L-threonylcarbamoyladenine synthase
MEVYLPSPQLCGDNAAMVAALGYRLIAAGKSAGFDEDVFSRTG